MLLPFAKIFSLCLRLFTRPAVNVFKSAFKKRDTNPPALQSFLVTTGHLYHDGYTRLQRGLTGNWRAPVKSLPEEKAFEAGVEIISEGIVYSVLFVWGIYEVRKMLADSQRKDSAQKALLVRLKEEAEAVEKAQTMNQARLLMLRSKLLSPAPPSA